jgi:Tol biopolymer transport system component
VLYEMLTGRKAFEGKSQATLIAAIVGGEPPPISTLQPIVPPLLDDVVRTCLAKDPDARWQSAGDLLHALTLASKYRGTAAPAAAKQPAISKRVVWAVAAVLLVAALSAGAWFWLGRAAASPRDVVRFQIAVPGTAAFRIAISPDGRSVAYVAAGTTGTPALWVRALDSDETREFPAIRYPTEIAWSPDERYIAFSSEGKLRTLDVASGTVQTLCDVSGTVPGLAWTADGGVLFGVDGSSETSGLFKVQAGGGLPQRFKALTPGTLKSLAFDGRSSLAIYLAETSKGRQVCVADLAGSELGCTALTTNTLFYSGSGHLLFSRGNTLFAQRFDTRRLQLAGDAAPIAADVSGVATGRKYVGVTGGAGTPVLAYISGQTQPTNQFTWFDRSGREQGTLGEAGSFSGFDLSADGRFVVASRRDSSGNTTWILDVRRAIATRAVTPPGISGDVIWAPDGSGFAYIRNEAGGSAIYEQPAFGGEPKVLVRRSGIIPGLEDWSRDGRFVALDTAGGGQRRGEAQPLDGGKPLILVSGTALVDEFRFSPDRHWVAYNSDESGRQEVYIAPFPSTGSRWQVSTSGGVQPRWRGDSRELFYLASDGTLTAATIRAGAVPDIGRPTPLFKSGIVPTYNLDHFSVTADGERFLVRAPVAGRDEALLKIVVNWDAGLKN